MVSRKAVGLVTGRAALARTIGAALVAAAAATGWWMVIDDIAVSRGMRTPIPYVILSAGLFAGVPTYLMARDWLGGSLLRFLALATAAILPAVLFAAHSFLYPRSLFAALLLLSTVWTGTATFWLFTGRLDRA